MKGQGNKENEKERKEGRRKRKKKKDRGYLLGRMIGTAAGIERDNGASYSMEKPDTSVPQDLKPWINHNIIYFIVYQDSKYARDANI